MDLFLQSVHKFLLVAGEGLPGELLEQTRSVGVLPSVMSPLALSINPWLGVVRSFRGLSLRGHIDDDRHLNPGLCRH